VTAAPERGRANDAVVSLLAEQLGVPRGSMTVVAGQTSRDKVIGLRGRGLDEAERSVERR